MLASVFALSAASQGGLPLAGLLLKRLERLRHYVCPKRATPVGNREVTMKGLNDWLQGRPTQPDAAGRFKFHKGNGEPPGIIGVGCEQRVPLWDEMEQCFASPEMQQRVRDLQEESAIELRNQSKERALVGVVSSTVVLADTDFTAKTRRR